MARRTDPGRGTDPGAWNINVGARCQLCLNRGLFVDAPYWHPVLPSMRVCAKHAGCTCSPSDPDPTCPVHGRKR